MGTLKLRAMALSTICAVALLGGCGGVDQGDQTACDLVANAMNTLNERIVNSSEASDVDKAEYRELVRAANADIAGQVTVAITKANDAELLESLTALLSLKERYDIDSGNADLGTAFFLQASTVELQCAAVGAAAEFKSADDFR